MLNECFAVKLALPPALRPMSVDAADGVSRDAPLFAQTERLFALVDAKDLEGLRALCSEPFGFVDVNAAGKPALGALPTSIL